MRQITRALRDTHRLRNGTPDDFSIRDESALIEAQRKISDVFRLLMPAISAVSLAAGGVGILTIMLLGIRERAAEIGLRRAESNSKRKSDRSAAKSTNFRRKENVQASAALLPPCRSV